jgi:hypothetical protein
VLAGFPLPASVGDLMRTFGVSRATVYRALQQVDEAEWPLTNVITTGDRTTPRRATSTGE